MGIRDEDLGDEIFLARRHAGAALAAAALGAIGGDRHALDVAAMGDGDDHVLALDQVLDVLLELEVLDRGAARSPELLFDRDQLGTHDRLALHAAVQGLQVIADLLGELAQVVGDLFSRSRPVRRCRRSSRIAFACASESW